MNRKGCGQLGDAGFGPACVGSCSMVLALQEEGLPVCLGGVRARAFERPD